MTNTGVRIEKTQDSCLIEIIFLHYNIVLGVAMT